MNTRLKILFARVSSSCVCVCSSPPSFASLSLRTCSPRPRNRRRRVRRPPKSSYSQVEHTQVDIPDRVFLIIWINAFNSCET